MQDKMECHWFKPSKHEVIDLRLFKNIQLENSQQNFNLNSTNQTKRRNKQNAQWNAFKMTKVSNTDNKQNWRFNHIF